MANPNCPIPSNINPLSPTGFKLSIMKLPDLTFFCQEANLPELTLPSIEQATPFSMAGIPGDMLHFGDLVVQFLVDEKLANYKGIFNWMVGLGFPENYQQYQNLIASDPRALNSKFGQMTQNYSDGTLEILGSQNTTSQTLLFRDLFPTSVSTLTFQANVTDINYLIGTATFRYTYYDFEDANSTSSAVGAAN